MKQSIKTITLGVLIVATSFSYSQSHETTDLYKQLKSNDSLLFEISFNKCDLSVLDAIMADDLEFYHDKGGITHSKDAFIKSMKNGLCKENNLSKSRRELVNGSLEVFPLYNNGILYGALQNGEHRFFESHNGIEKVGSIARFSHLWLKEGNQWIIKRVISYDHKMQPKQPTIKVTVPQTTLNTYLGTYEAPKTGTVNISKNETGLMLSAGKMKSPIHAKSETLFKHEQAPLTFEFITNNTGEVTKMVVRENGKIVEEAMKKEH